MTGIKKIFFIALPALFFACNSGSYTADLTDTPTSGNLNISADESYQPLIDSQVTIFMGLYPLAKINTRYRPEVDAINDFINDSVKLVVLNKKLTEEQLIFLKSKKCFPKTTRVAVDAVAFIVNENNPDTLLTMSQLKNILTGAIVKWKQINATNKQDSIMVVFDNNNSGNARFLKEKFVADGNFPSNCFAVKTNSEVINYVKRHENAMGVIAVNWISDSGDSVSNNFREHLKVVALQDEASPENHDFYQPYQAYVALNQYPLTRDVYVISRESRAGLGTGFASFVAGDQGQRIVRLSGLLPATMPVRIVKLN